MSSINKSMPQPPEITTKKKFGKNLNKLTKPPPATSTISAKSNASSRNGLLLLSTKRPTSSSTAASAGGILASKSASVAPAKPLPSLGLQNKSSASTHDALLGAVVGASRAESQEPDAWGVADKQKSNDADWNSDHGEVDPYQPVEPPNGGIDNPETELPSTTWDEYGGRNISATCSVGLYYPTGEVGEDQKATVRDRAEKKRAEEELRQSEQRERAAQKLRELEKKMAEEAPKDQIKPRTLYDPNRPTMISYSASVGGKDTPPSPEAPPQHNGSNGICSTEAHDVDSYNRQPVIHLSSYDDRDRGERGPTAAPRMLYDPKSGSMVAVPTRDDSTAAGRAKMKERGKKGKTIKETKDSRQEMDGAKGAKKGKRVDKKSGIESASPTKLEMKRGKVVNDRKLPRTCGVLYTRDSKGNFTSVDGCDGDLGYGSHSVPGGRVKNPDAYMKYLKEQKCTQEDAEAYKEENLDASYEVDGEEEVTLHTGFNAPESREVKFEWVKPTDRLELITGVDESPTLQATAKEWAPSQAALAAAAARFGAGGDKEIISDEEDDAPVSRRSLIYTQHLD